MFQDVLRVERHRERACLVEGSLLVLLDASSLHSLMEYTPLDWRQLRLELTYIALGVLVGGSLAHSHAFIVNGHCFDPRELMSLPLPSSSFRGVAQKDSSGMARCPSSSSSLSYRPETSCR